jgi:hypothetical protein
LTPGAHAEDALQQPLLDAAVGRQHAGHVLEAADGRVDRLLQLRDLPLVLDQLELGEELGQLAVAAHRGIGLVGEDGAVDVRVQAAQHPGTSGGALGEGAAEFRVRRGLDAQLGRLLGQRVRAADPQLAVAAAEERVGVLGIALVRVEHRVVTGTARAQHEHAVRVAVAGQVDEVAARPECVVGVVGPHLLVAGRDDQRLAGERLGQRRAPLGVVRRLRTRRDRERVLAPAAAHELQERLGKVRVV